MDKIFLYFKTQLKLSSSNAQMPLHESRQMAQSILHEMNCKRFLREVIILKWTEDHDYKKSSRA